MLYQMIIATAFSVIGALLVLANCRKLRKTTGIIIAIVLTIGVSALGIYLILNGAKDMDKGLLFPLFTPLATLLMMIATRIIYRIRTSKEIIFYMHGLIPARQIERYVTPFEKNLTYVLLLLSVAIPYFILKLML
jgi:hypothetical protein